MRARSGREARDAFVARLREIAGCVADRPLLNIGHSGTLPPHYHVAFAPPLEPAPIRLRSSDRLLLDVRCDYIVSDDAVRPNEAVAIVGYSYRVLAANESELLAYHLHTQGPSPMVDPHLHVSGTWRTRSATRSSSPELDGLHLPTGRVSLADVVHLLIVDFGAEPRRPDWESMLRRT